MDKSEHRTANGNIRRNAASRCALSVGTDKLRHACCAFQQVSSEQSYGGNARPNGGTARLN